MPGPRGDEVQLELFRRMTPEQKLGLAARLRALNMDLLLAGIRSRDSTLDAESARLEALRRVLPEGLFERAYPGR